MTLNPIALLPIPIVLFLIGLLAYAALRYADRQPPYPVWPSAPPKARHRLTPAAAARRDAAPLTAALLASDPAPRPRKAKVIEYDPLDHRIPLAEVERRMILDAIPAKIEQVRETAGDTVWSWSDENTAELVAAP
jgi:hypothetical protein